MPAYPKKYLKTITISYFYNYKIYEVADSAENWLEAVPVKEGVTRIAGNEYELRQLLDKDIHSIKKFYQRIK